MPAADDRARDDPDGDEQEVVGPQRRAPGHEPGDDEGGDDDGGERDVCQRTTRRRPGGAGGRSRTR